MTVTSADISLSATHSTSTTYRREESLLAGFAQAGEGFSEESLSSGRRITRIQEQSEAFSDATLLDRFQRGDNFIRLEDTRTEYLSSLRALQADFSADTINIADAILPPSAAGSETVESTVPSDVTMSAKDRARIDMIVTVVEKFTGKRIQMTDPVDYLESRSVDTQLDPAALGTDPAALGINPGTLPPAQYGSPQDSQPAEAAPGPEFGLRYTYEETYTESESTTFSAQGLIKTADGAEVSVDLSVSMSRSFSAEVSEMVEMGAALKDPLVINFSGSAAELTERKFHFDIDADGTSDQIHFVKPGSGFLALDSNGDGAVNDGSELFGTQSGDGFGDLAAYDDDGNGFIDNGDSVFEKLRVFMQDGAGNRQLAALGATGVEAIYLGHTSTPFEIKNERNELQGMVRETGLYVGENGHTGTVQQIDLVV